MSQENGVQKFKALFIQVHILAITWSAITGLIAGIIPAIAIYLLLIHLIPAAIYILGLENLTYNEIKGKLFKAPKPDASIFRTMKKNRNNVKAS